MRTTIEFDPDVAAELSRRRAEGRGTLRDDVNRLVRLGLAREREQEPGTRTRFCTPTFDSGRPLTSVDDVEAAIVHAEGEDHR
ncbi:MAG: CopG family transcriptional regulator [Solirubrobacteraceae bacterium]